MPLILIGFLFLIGAAFYLCDTFKHRSTTPTVVHPAGFGDNYKL